MPCPSPLASSGNFLAPKRIRTTARIKTISQPPNNAANRVFINIVFLMLTLGCPVGPVKHQSRDPAAGNVGQEWRGYSLKGGESRTNSARRFFAQAASV